MSIDTAGRLSERPRRDTPHGQWERAAPWMAPLVTAGVLALATFVLFASCGAALI